MKLLDLSEIWGLAKKQSRSGAVQEVFRELTMRIGDNGVYHRKVVAQNYSPKLIGQYNSQSARLAVCAMILSVMTEAEFLKFIERWERREQDKKRQLKLFENE